MLIYTGYIKAAPKNYSEIQKIVKLLKSHRTYAA